MWPWPGSNGRKRISANLLISGYAVLMCRQTEYRATPADLRDEQTNKRTNEHAEAYGLVAFRAFRPINVIVLKTAQFLNYCKSRIKNSKN